MNKRIQELMIDAEAYTETLQSIWLKKDHRNTTRTA